MTYKSKGLLCFLLCLVIGGCSLFYKTVGIELPNKYEGWIFVLPVSDATKASLKVKDGKYIVDDDGLVCVPASMMKGVDRYKIYQNGQDIEKTMQYTGLAEDHIKGGDRRYVVFYLAPTKNTSLTSSENQTLQGSLIEGQRIEKMKYLLASGKLHFRYPFFQR